MPLKLRLRSVQKTDRRDSSENSNKKASQLSVRCMFRRKQSIWPNGVVLACAFVSFDSPSSGVILIAGDRVNEHWRDLCA